MEMPQGVDERRREARMSRFASNTVSEEARGSQMARATRPSRPPRVLIVEDETLIAMLLSDLVRRFGYDVVGSVATGEEAISMALSQQPDLVLMDLTLGGDLSGIDAAEAIRAAFACPIVFLTAHGSPGITARMKRISGSAILGKPLDEKILRMTLRQVLEDREEGDP